MTLTPTVPGQHRYWVHSGTVNAKQWTPEVDMRRPRHRTVATAAPRPVQDELGPRAPRATKDRARLECCAVDSIQILQAPMSRRPSLPRVLGEGLAKAPVNGEFTFAAKGVVLPCIHAPFLPAQRLSHRDPGAPAQTRRKARPAFSDPDLDSTMPGGGGARRRLLAWTKTPKHINRQVYREMVRQHCFITLRHYEAFARGATSGGKTKHLRRAAALAKVDISLPCLWQSPDVGHQSEVITPAPPSVHGIT